MAEITGKHVFAVTAAAFAVIVAVNLTMAYQAVSTFPGLEVKNAYVASQGFNDRKAAQEALGWTLDPRYADGRIELAFTDRAGRMARVYRLEVLVGRTTTTAADARPVFSETDRGYAADLTLGRGKWMLKVIAWLPDGTLFEQRALLFVQE
jgi:nitrogen fixation protein FixH